MAATDPIAFAGVEPDAASAMALDGDPSQPPGDCAPAVQLAPMVADAVQPESIDFELPGHREGSGVG
jgi:hypothetical protein